MTTKLNIHHQLYRGQKVLQDPGDGGTITVTQDLQICEMVVSASGETRTLTNPTKAGIRFVVRLKTDGGGALVLTAAAGLNVAVETEATFSEASDFLSLISVTKSASAGTFRWEIMEGNVATVVSSATPSHTPSHTSSPSHTASHTASHTPSST